MGEGIPEKQAECPARCHACCTTSVRIDLTGLEALLVYLLNQDMAAMVIEHYALKGDTGFCPFLIADICVIHDYKPTACQMFMPYFHQGKTTCSYRLNQEEYVSMAELQVDLYLNSYAYDIHGYMMLAQQRLKGQGIPERFDHIFQGVEYWTTHYPFFPEAVRLTLDAVLRGGEDAKKWVSDFEYDKALSQGHAYYLSMSDYADSYLGKLSPGG